MPEFSNYQDVLDQLQKHGLSVTTLEVDTPKVKRCPIDGYATRDTRGWYWLSSMSIGSETLIIGAYGIYQGDDNGKQTVKISKQKRDKLSPEQIEAQKIRQREAQKKAEQERRKEADKAAARAKKLWSVCLPDGTSEYLRRKQSQAHGVRFTETGTVVVPLMDDHDSIRGLQFIYPKGHKRSIKLNRNKEFWPIGIQMAGTYFLIGGMPRHILLIAEGYATGATLHQATGLPIAIVWSANNILPACQVLKNKFKKAQQLICADDDYLQKCAACGKFTVVVNETCIHCQQPHKKANAGIRNAQSAAIAINGSWIIPEFPKARPTDKKGLTDFNDLHVMESVSLVRQQIQSKIADLGWTEQALIPDSLTGGGGKHNALKSILSIDEAVARFALVFGGKGTMFDYQEHILVPKVDVLDILPEHGWRDMRSIKKVVRLEEVGFDPSGTDKKIQCNLWGGWPTVPKKGNCESLLELLGYLCSNEENYIEVFQWILKWLAYPIQHPGAKMRTALIFHGPQGTGKNLFFESIMAIYDEYGRIVDQAAIEDKFNDWASKKLFLIADEVVARSELFHIKNKLKCFVTGEWIRINPKNVAAHDERNHVNLVFLSNESQPLVLEKDDRRYTVIHTPAKLDETFYQQVRDELKNGGIAALHYHLLNLDLTGFDEHSKPPATQAKIDLIDVSMDSVNSFITDWIQGDVADVPVCPCLGSHLYNVYRKHSEKRGEKKLRTDKQFIGAMKMLDGWKAGAPISTLENYNSSTRKNRRMIIPPDALISPEHAKTYGQTQEYWLTECFFAFAKAAGIEP